MSHRPRQAKGVARLRKAFRRTPPAFLDIINWLEFHGYADTAGQARKIILDKRLRSESHVIGLVKAWDPLLKKNVDVIERLQPNPAQLRRTLRVVGT